MPWWEVIFLPINCEYSLIKCEYPIICPLLLLHTPNGMECYKNDQKDVMWFNTVDYITCLYTNHTNLFPPHMGRIALEGYFFIKVAFNLQLPELIVDAFVNLGGLTLR